MNQGKSVRFRRCPATVFLPSGGRNTRHVEAARYLSRLQTAGSTHMVRLRSVWTAIEGVRVRSKTLITTATAAGVLLATAPALAGDAGLYGSSDPPSTVSTVNHYPCSPSRPPIAKSLPLRSNG